MNPITFFPRTIGIEIVRGCNFSCRMCPVTSHAPLERKKFQFMDLSLLRELTEEIDRWPTIETIFFFHFGEPLAHPHFRECLEILNRSSVAKKACVIQFTNASLLKGDKAEAILDIPIVKKLIFSFDGFGDKESFERLRGNHFEEVLENIREFSERARQCRPDLVMATCTILPRQGEVPGQEIPDRGGSLKQLHDLFDPLGVQVEVRSMHDYSGNEELILSGKRPERILGGCPHIERDSLYVTLNGWVQPCCAVYSEAFHIGRFPDRGFGELLNHAQMNRIRHSLRLDQRAGLPFCSTCTVAFSTRTGVDEIKAFWKARDEQSPVQHPEEREYLFGKLRSYLEGCPVERRFMMGHFLGKLWGDPSIISAFGKRRAVFPAKTSRWPVRLRCPACKAPISYRTPLMRCRACGHGYNVEKGIVQFTEAQGHWPDIPEDDFNRLIEETEALGWRKALQNLDGKLPGWFRRTADEARADFVFLSSPAQEKVALDIGTGWGPVIPGLARNCTAVVGTDRFLSRLVFLEMRCAQDGIENVYLAQADALDLPFEEAEFDLVSMIGSFEWVGVDPYLPLNPDECQEKCLRECHRVLKPGGELIVGIENRIGIKYLLGQPDDHTQITNITFLPRAEANLRSRQLTGRDFGIRTHSIQEYQNIIRVAGFSDSRFFAVFPYYQFCEAMIPLTSDGPLDYYLNYLQWDEGEGTELQKALQVLRTLSSHGHAAEYVNHLFVVARK